MQPILISDDERYAVVDHTQWHYIKDKIGMARGQQRCVCGGADPERRALNDKYILARGNLAPCHLGHISYAVVRYTPEHWDATAQPPPVVAPSPAVAKKAIPDWPIPCPKCQRAASAVLLFSGYDCKHGCYH